MKKREKSKFKTKKTVGEWGALQEFRVSFLQPNFHYLWPVDSALLQSALLVQNALVLKPVDHS